jgi:hypothetical protein
MLEVVKATRTDARVAQLLGFSEQPNEPEQNGL